jgi:hypothetical protein
MHDGASAYLSVLCEMFSITPIIWIGRGGPTACPPRPPDLNPLDFYLCEGNLLTTKTRFTIALWMPLRLSATTPASLNGCDGPWWDVSRCAMNLMEDTLSNYYKCTLSAITSGYMLIWTCFLDLVCGIRGQSCVHTFQLNLTFLSLYFHYILFFSVLIFTSDLFSCIVPCIYTISEVFKTSGVSYRFWTQHDPLLEPTFNVFLIQATCNNQPFHQLSSY